MAGCNNVGSLRPLTMSLQPREGCPNVSAWHLIWPQLTFQIHVPINQPKWNTHSCIHSHLQAFVQNCLFCCCCSPGNFSSPQTKSWRKKKEVLMFKNTIQTSRSCSHTGSLPAVPRFCPLYAHHTLPVPCNATFWPTYYLCFLSLKFHKVLEGRNHVFCSVTSEAHRWGKGRRREEEERKEKKREDGRSTWWGGKFSFKVFLVIQELLAEARSFDYTIFFPGQFWETE